MEIHISTNNNSVALNVTEKPTLTLSPSEARNLADSLIKEASKAETRAESSFDEFWRDLGDYRGIYGC